jgi:HEAT repeat protein
MILGAAALAAMLLVGSAGANEEEALGQFLARIASKDDEVRYKARFEAVAFGAAAVEPLGKLIGHEDVNVAVTARAALEKVVHHSGRPGAESERVPVSEALCRLLAPAHSNDVRREALHLISFIGGDGAVPAVARLLDDEDPHVSEAARLALEEMPGAAPALALVEAVKKGSGGRALDCLFSLGKKGERATIPFLVETAANGSGPLRLAALEALAYAGAPEGVPLFEAAAEGDEAERAFVFREFLRLADNLAAGGQDAAAAAIYRRALAKAPLDHQRERALLRLSPRGTSEGVDELVASLADLGERVRGLALERLTSIEGGEVTGRLKSAYVEAPDATRPALLRALSRRDQEGAKRLVEEARESSNPELRLVAHEILGELDNPELLPLFAQVAKSGSPQGKHLALTGELRIAARRLEEGKKDEALAGYRSVLALTEAEGQRREALRGIEEVGDPAALEALAPLLKDATLAADAAEIYILLAAKEGAAGDLDRAESHLMEVVLGSFSRDVKTRATDELRKLGRDPLRNVRKAGFVVDWWLVGPIEDADGAGLEKRFFPEEAIDLEKVHLIGPRRFRWQRLKDLPLDGRVDLVPVFRRSDRRLAYGHTEVESPAETDVLFKIGSNDGVACWLNGERVHLNPASRTLTVDEDVVKVRLREGRNRILIKVVNASGGWEFCLRSTRPDGTPLELAPALESGNGSE